MRRLEFLPLPLALALSTLIQVIFTQPSFGETGETGETGGKVVHIPMATSTVLDGRCSSSEYRDARSLPVGDQGRLLLQQDPTSVHLCFDLPDGSLGVVDLYLFDEASGETWQLHISAKLGERQRQADGSWPEWTWWNQRDWSGTVVPWQGCVVRDGEARPKFENRPVREMHISKARFGGSSWRVLIHVDGVAQRDGSSKTVSLPAAGELGDPRSWATYRLADSAR